MRNALKPIRRKIIAASTPDTWLGLWTRFVKLACGHKQFISSSTYERVPKTTICYTCSRLNDSRT